MHDTPVSLTLAWWGTSWLRGLSSPDDLLDALAQHGVRHVVAALDGPSTPLLEALGLLRAGGATQLGAAFGAPGDPVGLGGPAAFNAAALEAEEAVVAPDLGVGWVPAGVGAAVEWTAHAAHRRPLPDVGEADRGLRSGVLVAADALARLDVARWNPDLADELMDLARADALVAPPGVPARCVSLAARALRMLRLTELAGRDHGGALSAAETQARHDVLEQLARHARRGLTAAGSPEVWPPA
ncbi:hypothetical protein RDV89_05010 [Nocardioides zeae]|uniref:Uncharacterized protein n=1 Tax=Nocardioides imazamoxiresistens TaxID=3231893 RepID=A0ABU3PT84_9ACTN|nr:hypothetical protein [Nocardioides zeae]MDT9592414.1 hypothetical protein [Nocardioides zeae]